ncbi:MAG: glycosyltransferase [bacterium JZ-2024 1]
MSIALVHDWLVDPGGAEAVLRLLIRLFPHAPLYTLFYSHGWQKEFPHTTFYASYLQRFPAITRFYRNLLPLFPRAVESLHPKEDWVISNSHCVAKGVIPRADAFHICYCYTPMRYAWDLEEEYLKSLLPGVRFLAGSYLHRLRQWDVSASHRVDLFLAVSRFVAKRIEKYYRRESQVIYPPVDVDFFHPPEDGKREDYFLVVSRLVPYKRVDVALTAAKEAGVRLKIVGTGPLEEILRARAGENVDFLGRVHREKLRELYQRAQALIHPAVEDFGMVLVEALACGTPVITCSSGGNVEIVEKCQGGILFEDVLHLKHILSNWDPSAFSPESLARSARFFSPERFCSEFRSILSAYGYRD